MINQATLRVSCSKTAHKRARLDKLPPPVCPVHYVPVDLAREDMAAALADAGHDPHAPTCWIWEGVVFYLSHAQVNASLSAIAARAASGSRLLCSYRPVQARWPWHVSAFAGATLRMLGEPVGEAWTPRAFADALAAHDFAVRWDRDPQAWFAEVGVGKRPRRLPGYERLVCAVK